MASLITCPHCGVRPQEEFSIRGDASPVRPAAGARRAFHVLLRLPAEVEDVFTARLRQAFPLRADKVMSLLTG